MTDPRTIRAWARTHGYDVATVGAIPEHILEAYEQRDVRPDFVPLDRHRKAARRIAETSRRHGAIEVLREVEDLLYDDVPLVMVALARLTWTPIELPENDYTEDEAREAHRRHMRGDKSQWVRHGERAYQRFWRRRQRRKEAS